MRKLFPGYYRPTDEEFDELWRQALFAFDANMMLNLYRYSETTRDQFLRILGSAEIRDRIWLPHQAALEYQRNRFTVIDTQRAAYRQIRDGLDKALEGLGNKVLAGFIDMR